VFRCFRREGWEHRESEDEVSQTLSLGSIFIYYVDPFDDSIRKVMFVSDAAVTP
jgi:hypothetical protein